MWFEWTKLAEGRWQWHNKVPRKAGEPVLMVSDGEWIRRKTVPTSWITAGYVIESEGVQTDLFDYL